MKIIYKDKITNIEDTDLFDNKFLFKYISSNDIKNGVEIINLGELLKEKKNAELLDNIGNKYAMYSNVYSIESELDIFNELFNDAIKNNKKIHITGITLKEEVEILEKYYTELGFLREDINCFSPDFSKPLVTVSVNIENLIRRGSDYKAQGKNIFFIPPIRESGQNKAMFKGINRGVIAGININNYNQEIEKFLGDCVREEKILPLTLSKLLKYNLVEIGFSGNEKDLVINY